ncbi:cytochrome P450 [Phytohabitans houttuyneae]|uniref:Cytochrome P450 n=1 Tax=Phytohabitans houttuyneae TaxID=1076126 RepID=A0A6V8KIG1_9ACTN|nr:cytochrome P450 [Phytohabitans houttuyneae]
MPNPMTMTLAREHPFDPPANLRSGKPIQRLSFPDGHLGWLVTGYEAARQVLGDARFSARQELRHSPVRLPIIEQGGPARPGWFVRMDAPEHTRYRRLLTRQFSMRRMTALTPRIEAIVEEHLDAMARQGPPVDLVRAYALPIPSLVICELLGVPYSEREHFQQQTAALLRVGLGVEEFREAITGLGQFVYGLVRSKRGGHGDDVLSGLAAHAELTDEELTGIAMLLLVAGHETTANMLALGTYALLRDPHQLAALRADPSLAENAVEELLRYLSIIHIGLARTALEDVELAGERVAAGETVVVAMNEANRDAAQFDDPDRLAVDRPAGGHLAFGHGVHQCLGQQLARIEMRVGFSALLRRFPDLRLAVPPEEVPLRTDMAVHGVHRLPVTW